MQQLQLHFEKQLKESFSLQKLNFLFVFQVNCPGCFFYGFPMVERLYKEFNGKMSFMGLSTAFEDFELNTFKNTELLVKEAVLVGETHKAFLNQGFNELPYDISVPVFMDAKADTSVFDYKKAALNICNTNPNYVIWPQFEQEALQEKVITYLKGLKEISLTFTLNQLSGTPTFIIFNDVYEILYHKFGHIAIEDLRATIKTRFLKLN